jgi:hypothetical protein
LQKPAFKAGVSMPGCQHAQNRRRRPRAAALSDTEMGLDMIEEVRRVWQFYRDRRPDSYGPMAEQLP